MNFSFNPLSLASITSSAYTLNDIRKNSIYEKQKNIKSKSGSKNLLSMNELEMNSKKISLATSQITDYNK